MADNGRGSTSHPVPRRTRRVRWLRDPTCCRPGHNALNGLSAILPTPQGRCPTSSVRHTNTMTLAIPTTISMSPHISIGTNVLPPRASPWGWWAMSSPMVIKIRMPSLNARLVGGMVHARHLGPVKIRQYETAKRAKALVQASQANSNRLGADGCTTAQMRRIAAASSKR